MPATTLRLSNDLPIPLRVAGCVVEFYTTAGVFETSGTTDVNGEVTATLLAGFHDVLFYKQGLSILPKQPQRIEVLALPATNVFLVTGHARVRPESIDPLRCTVSGHILGADGKKTKSKLIFSTKKGLLVLSSNIIAPELQLNASSDDNGYFEFELLRGVCYSAYFTYLEVLLGMNPGVLDILVPDQPSVTIDTLLFPVPVNMDFSANVKALVAGAGPNEDIDYTLTHSDGSVRNGGTPWAGITLTNTDSLVVEAALRDGKLCLTPLTAGVATITVVRSMSDRVLFDPVPVFQSEQVVVTVT